MLGVKKDCSLPKRSSSYVSGRSRQNGLDSHSAGLNGNHAPSAWRRLPHPLTYGPVAFPNSYFGTSGRGSETKPSRLGIFTAGRVVASMTASAGTMPF